MNKLLILPYAGGLAIIASALKGTPVSLSDSMQGESKEFIISFNWFLWTGISEGPEGKNPLFLTISTTKRKKIEPNLQRTFELKDYYE